MNTSVDASIHWLAFHYKPTNYTHFKHGSALTPSIQNFIRGAFYAETAICLFLQLLNLFMLHRLQHKMVTDLLKTQLTLVQAMLVPTNLALFEYLDKGQTLIQLSLGASLDLVQALLFILIIVDRVLAVKLANRYSQVVKRGGVLVIVILIWGVSIFYGAANIGFHDWKSVYDVQVTCDIMLLIVFVMGYSYVEFKVGVAKQTLMEDKRATLIHAWQGEIRYGVQMSSVIIYFYFSFLTTVSVLFGIRITSIHYLLWTFTYLLEAIVHICGLRKSCSCFEKSNLPAYKRH